MYDIKISLKQSFLLPQRYLVLDYLLLSPFSPIVRFISLFLPTLTLSSCLSKQSSLCAVSQCFLSFWLSRLITLSPRALGMQVLSLLSLCVSLSDCMKMNFNGLLIDCPLLYISSLPATGSLIAHSDRAGLYSHPLSKRSPSLPHQL